MDDADPAFGLRPEPATPSRPIGFNPGESKEAQPMGIEPTVIVDTERGPVDVDASIAPIVDALNKAGVPTIASCSGHGHRPGNIALRDGRELIIARDFEEARRIERLFPIGANGEPVNRETEW